MDLDLSLIILFALTSAAGLAACLYNPINRKRTARESNVIKIRT